MSDDELISKFNIKPCRVNLNRLPNTNISCSKQTSSNNIAIKINRKRSSEDMNCCSSLNRPKRFKSDIKTNDKTKPKANRKINSKKPKNQLVALSKLEVQHAKNAAIGDVVLCKIRGFPDWPAIVTEVAMPQKGLPKITVTFFGDKTTHTTTIMNILPFFACRDLMISKLCGRKNPLYGKSIREAQSVLQVNLIDDIYL